MNFPALNASLASVSADAVSCDSFAEIALIDKVLSINIKKIPMESFNIVFSVLLMPTNLKDFFYDRLKKPFSFVNYFKPKTIATSIPNHSFFMVFAGILSKEKTSKMVKTT